MSIRNEMLSVARKIAQQCALVGVAGISPKLTARQVLKESIELAMIAGYSPDDLCGIVNETLEEKGYIYDGL